MIVWILALGIMPGIIYLLSLCGTKVSRTNLSTKQIFFSFTGAINPLGLMLWIAFVIPMLFVNISFIIQSISDPFGWGWDLFGTANTPWHQLLPMYIPGFQAVLILTGLYLSLRNLRNSWQELQMKPKQVFLILLPMTAFLAAISAGMLFFFTN